VLSPQFVQTAVHADTKPYHFQCADSLASLGAEVLASGILAGKPQTPTSLCALIHARYKFKD